MNLLKRFSYAIFLLVLAIIFFYQFFVKVLIPIPADTIIGLYHPFRDLYAANYPNGIPFKNPLITDPVRQQYPWKKLVIDAEKKMEIPLWNPYSLSGNPLLANFQSSPFYPLNILMIILPFNIGWGFFIFSQTILALIFMYLFLREQNLRKESSLFGAIAFSFCGFFIAWLEWGTVVSTALWAPLVLLSIDKILNRKLRWVPVLFFSVAFSFFAGHIQIFFYTIVLYVLYLAYSIWENKKNIKNIWWIILGLLISLVIISPQLIPTFKFISLSARSVDLDWKVAGWFISPGQLLQFLIPDFFGNPATLNYFGVWNYAEMIGYVGIIPLMLAFLSIFTKKSKVYFFWFLILISLIFSLPTFFAKLPFILNIPFLSTAQPTRLLFIIDLSLSICGAFGLDYLIEKKPKRNTLIVIVALIVLFALSFGFTIFGTSFSIDPANLIVARRNIYLPGLIFLASSIVLIIYIFNKNKKLGKYLVAVLILITIFDLFRFGWKFLPFVNQNYIFPQTKTLQYLENQPDKNFRIISDNSEIMPPNFSAVYHLQDVSGYDPLYLLRYGEFISAMQRGIPDINAPFGFNRLITPQNTNSPLFGLLNVKYLLSFSDIKDDSFKLVNTEGMTKIYENQNLIPRAFFVKKVINTQNKNEDIKTLFKGNFDSSTNATVENGKTSNYSSGAVRITNYSSNSISIETQNSAPGFLVLLDVYYPSWSAYVDGVKTEIFLTDYTFRGIAVPAGKHIIEFRDNLL